MYTIKLLLLSTLITLLPITSSAKDIKLLTSIKPLQLIAAAIQQDISQPDVLLPIGTSPHHYTLRPADIQRIQQADLLYWIGQDMEIFLTKTIQTRNKPTIAIQTLPGIKLRHFGDDHETHDSQDHEHQTGNLDPHLWLSPTNAKVIATQMATDLSQLDPTNQTKYQQNLQQFLTTLTATDKNIRHQLTTIKLKPFFVLHETYDYFEDTYHLKHTAVFSINPSIQPSIKHLTEMKAILQASGNSCVFYEPPIKPKLINTLTEGLPVHTYSLDAMGSDIPVTPDGYPNLLNTLTQQLLKCQ